MMIKYLTTCPYFEEQDINWILDEFKNILKGNGMLSMGKYVREFEAKFARYIGAQYAVATSSCTGSLEIALQSIGVKEHDEIIVPTNSFFADASAIIKVGATPIFAEIEANTLCISYKDVVERITDKTKAIILIHMLGVITPDIYKIKELCSEKNIILIEDASHAHGASIDGIKAGNIGDVSCFSFGSTKIMAIGEGGMILTNNQQIYKEIDSYRNRGLDLNSEVEQYSKVGSNYRLSEVNALLGISQLNKLDDSVEHRNKIAEIYTSILKPLEKDLGINVLIANGNVVHSYWRYAVILDDSNDRLKIRDKMDKLGIVVSWPYNPPTHLQPVVRNLYGYSKGSFPQSEKILKSHICLPIHDKIEESDAKYIAESLVKVIKDIN